MKNISTLASSAILATAVAAGAAFTAFADGLPAGYTQVPFIKANGNCQIKTGITPACTDKVEMQFRPAAVNVTQNLWCSRTGSGATSAQFTAFLVNSAKVRFDRGDGGANVGQITSTGTLLASTNYLVVADYATLEGVVTNVADNTEVVRVTMPSGDYTPGSELCLFASHTSDPDAGLSNYGSYALYSFKLSDSAGNLKLDLVPAKRDADGVLGLYDLVRSTFLTNSQSGFFTTSGMTITPSDPEWGKALTIASDTVIDAGSGATWAGALTVYGGATLTTRGNLTVVGTTTVNVNGALDVETGTANFTFGSRTMSGALYIRAGAQLNMNRSDAFNYHAAFAVHVYGTFNAQTFRTSVGVEDTVYFHDGARIIGAGDGNGAFDFFDNGCRLFVDGNVTCEAPLRARAANYNLNVTCFENAHINFAGGFAGSAGIVKQVAATAEQGNASGTCANAFIEVGANPSMTGKFVLISPAAISLKGETQTFTVETSAAELEVRAKGDVARANHVLVQKLPAITTSTATVSLVGDGVCAFLDAAPTFPVMFAGASLAIATNAPVALAAGSSVISNTVIGVEGLAVETAETLLTGVDSTFDVSKVSAQAMYNGVLLGTPAAASLDGAGAVVTAGVTAYDATAWIEPYIESKALIWLDASDAANFEFKDNTFGLVTKWKDRSSYKRDATAYTISGHNPNWGTLSVTNGVYAYCMGACNSGIDLAFSARMTTIRTVFWSMSIVRNLQAFFLGDTSSYRFHRGNNGAYCYNNGNALWKNGRIFCDGAEVTTDKFTTLVPTDRHIYSTVTAANCESDRLTADRDCDNYGRHGGREISELIAFDVALSDSDRQAIEAYLAAKWMGANPTAAGTEGTYEVTGDLAVDDHVGGDKNISFSEGASITVVNPSSTGAMVATTGAVTIPAGSPLVVNVDARALPLGTYTVIDAAGGITSVSQFAATAATAAGSEATFSVVDGKLVMTISQAASSTTGLTWRPENASDLAWNSANWLYSDGVTKGPFIGYLPTSFDGGESVTGDIAVTDTYPVGPMSITGANDYNFTGTGTLAGSDPIVIDTTGTVSFSGPNLGDQDIVVSNGTLRVGQNPGAYALGTRAGKIKVAGGTLDLNTAANNGASALISHRKEIELSRGGSVLNNGVAVSFGSIGNLTVLDTGTIGGAQRFDIRSNSSDTECTTTTVDGDENAVLNVALSPAADAVVFHNAAVNIGRINVQTGKMRVEQPNGEYNVPNGIHVADGAILGYYSGTSTTGATVNVDSGTAQIQAENGTSYMKGPLAVASGATAQLCGGNTLNYEGGVQNAGTVRTTAGTHILKGDISGTSYEVAGGQMRLAGAVQESSLTIPVSSSSLYVKDGMTAETITANVTGGDAGILLESAVAPVFDAYNLNLGGNISYILPRVAGQIVDLTGTVNINQADAGTTYVYSTTNNNEFGVAMKMVGTVGSLRVGLHNGRAGTLQLKEGTDVSAKFLATGDGGASSSRGRVIIDSGAKVTIRSGGDVRNGHWHTAPATVSTHVLDIAGELDSSVGVVYNPMDTPRAELYLREGGVLKAKGLSLARRGSGTDNFDTYVFPYGSGVGAAEARNFFVMEGGRLELGASGITGTRTPGSTKVDFRNGEIVNAAAWGGSLVAANSFINDERNGDYGLPMFFGYDAVGGNVTFDLGSYNVNWQTGLSGASDVTLKGSANFQGGRFTDRMQGVMLGKLTVENTGANDLRVTSAFAGGLALAPGVNAQVAKYGETNYAYAASIGSKQWDFLPHLAETAWSYNFISSDFFNYAYKKFSTSPIASTTISLGRGEFYVPADKAGVWTFAGNYDDRIALHVDGTQLFKTTAWSQVGRGTNTLSAGWHKFTLAFYDGGKPGGPSSDGWGDGKGLGFHVGETTATAASNYIKFADGEDFGDGTKFQVRPSPNVAVWSFCNAYNVNTWPTREDWTHIKCIDALTVMYKNSKASDANTWKSYIFGKTSKFEGWFRVEDDKAGTWTFKAAYDDRSLLKIDGVQVCRSDAWNSVATGTAELSAGWHRWEVRVGEGAGGGWGPDSDVNGGNTVSYIAPGDTEKRFDENNLKLAATLGDVALIEPNGIHKELELGAGATLTSSGTMPMSIYGTLKGTGSLAGSWEFAGDHNCWEVTNAVAKTEALPAATFAAATPATFAGLKNVKVTFDARPTRREYYLTGAVAGLTEAPAATVIATDGENDYSANFTLTVKDGRLALGNSKPGGIMILVR